ncbi:MAG TPA: hypothetical protein VNI83_06060 [Vicinamibacterales bacterium]|nr:hypothetical protein [Vicinamibacterales bacterium]
MRRLILTGMLLMAVAAILPLPPLQPDSPDERRPPTPAPPEIIPASPAPPAVEAEDRPREIGAWQRHVSISPMDDAPVVVYRLEALAPIRGWLTAARPSLVVRCKAQRTDVFLTIGLPLAVELDDERTLQIRIDGEPAREERWGLSTDEEALFAPRPIALARRLARAERLRLRVTPFMAAPAVIEFDVRGFAGAAEELARFCGWPASSIAR